MGRRTPRCKRGYQSRTCRQVRARAGTALLLTLRLVLLPLALLVPMVGEVKVRDGEPQQHVPRHTVGHAVGIEGTKGVQVDPVASDTLALQAGQVAQVRLHGVHGRGADAGVDRDALRYEVHLERHPPACLPAPESAMGDEARQLCLVDAPSCLRPLLQVSNTGETPVGLLLIGQLAQASPRGQDGLE